MQIKTKRWYHLTPVRIAIIKRQEITTVGESCVITRESLFTVGGNVISTTAMEDSMKFLQNIKTELLQFMGLKSVGHD